ncbi:site-specific integrase [Marinovum sp. 2_MG-2023]|uniref:tyrosine-type recombinase/integrase n=1 Tax=unclassified Marinovum TaxID=2647166 RepID=UPI0026E48E80|nr:MULTISPECIES: tyrosine-type recombinase/integrase [unclassified Marinovum]MDO6732446.1 site-specific integrase [Marinovum sp. 2_MG-2023]MDO6781721.1 site-specific integrase [Marinovum sp. 1_MG-2023]
MDFDESDSRYVDAYQNAKNGTRSEPKIGGKSTRAILGKYFDSVDFKGFADRTKKDYLGFLNSFEIEFGDDPIAIFEEPESVDEIREWRKKWDHSPKRYDYAGTVVTRFLNWALKINKSLKLHHHTGQKKQYKSNRAEVIWLPEEIEALLNEATLEESRVIIAASEGGLAPQDIGVLRREHVQKTQKGRRLFLKRAKTGNPISLPVTPALGALIDTMPEGQDLIVPSLTGGILTANRASGVIRGVKERHNAKAEKDDTLIPIRHELRPYDLRGTAATQLLRAGCSLNQIAVTMGWGLRHAANVIENYAALVPEVSDEVLEKLTAFRSEAHV